MDGSPELSADVAAGLEIPDFPSVESETFKKEVVIPYFKDIYKDLAQRSDRKDKGVNKVTLIEYSQLPGILGDRFFAIMDTNSDDYVDLKEFIVIMFKIYYSNLDTQIKMVFDIYDFNKDGKISPEDVRIILGFVPLL